MKHSAMLRRATLTAGALLLAVIASVGVADAESEDSAGGDTAPVEVVIELRVWQDVHAAENIWVSARPSGGSWRTLGTVPLGLEHIESAGRYRSGDVAVAGVTLRFWQSRDEAGQIFVRPCSGACPGRAARPWASRLWRPLGMLALPLDDGHSTNGRYRFGDLAVAVPAANPGLLADREYLLALKDGLEGAYGPDLNWRAATAIARWEGITAGGVPPRVTKLQLSDRGLQGELWGWLGNLTELRELRLDGNRLYGRIPSKLGQLSNLTHLYIRGNSVGGCLPPPLRTVLHHDFVESLGVPPDCVPTIVPTDETYYSGGSGAGMTGGTYQRGPIVYDVPESTLVGVVRVIRPAVELIPGVSFSPLGVYGGVLLTLISGPSPESWVLLDPVTGEESERHAANAFGDALLDQIVASVWIAEGGQSIWR